MAEDSGADLDPRGEADVEVYCARHPQVETALRCGRCGTPICPRCLVQTPVGARCPTCANVRALPTIDVKPIFVARGLAAAILTGLVIGGAWGFITGPRGGFIGIFIIFIALGIGYAMAEAVSLATNRKLGTALQACAIVGCVVAYLTRNAFIGVPLLPSGDVWGYIATALAAFSAAQRLSR